MRQYRLWTTREVQQIRTLAKRHDAPTIAKMLNRTKRSVDSAALRHGIHFTALRAWTEAEDKTLAEKAKTLTARQAAEVLGRSEYYVRRRAAELGIRFKKSGHLHHSAKHPLKLRQQYVELRAGGMAQATAARQVGVHQATARRWEEKKEEN
jgi:hypothetical protein